MTEKGERTPIDQLVDLFVYAPVGLAYEYHDVLPKLIKRGKSQVQIAKLLGTMAAKQGQKTVEGRLEDVIDTATSSVAQGITDVGARVGLAPDAPSVEPAAAPAKPKPAKAKPAKAKARPAKPDKAADTDRPLPIAGYDDLTAKQIVALLADLEPSQRDRVQAHETANRARKTVLAKLASLAEAN